MATKTAKKRSTSKRSTAKRSAPKGIQHALAHNPFPPKAKVKVYDAFGQVPEGMPVGKPLSTASVKANGELVVRVPRAGRYLAAADKDGTVYRLEFSVNK
jgi:hypothetical protein